jgi:hypothetical protein
MDNFNQPPRSKLRRINARPATAGLKPDHEDIYLQMLATLLGH